MPLLLRLFFIRRSKNNQRRSHAGKRRPNGFSKKTDVPGCLEHGHVQTRDCSSEIGAPVFKKIPDRFARHGRMHEDKTSSRPRRNAVERALFHNGLCTGRGRLQENAACQADASGCARGSVRSFKKIQPLVASLQEDCASNQEQQIQSRQGQSRKVMAAGAPGQEDVNQPERFSGLQRTVEAWQLSGPGLHAPARPGRSAGLLARYVGGYGRAGEQARAARSSGIRDRAAETCRKMREPGNTVAHRLCASGLWAIGKLAD